MVLPSPWAATKTTFSPFAMKSSEKTRSTVGRSSCFGQVHSKSARGFEAAESRRLQLSFEPSAGARLEFGLHEGVEQDGRAPAGPRRPGDQVVEAVSGIHQPEPAQVSGQGRRRQWWVD